MKTPSSLSKETKISLSPTQMDLIANDFISAWIKPCRKFLLENAETASEQKKVFGLLKDAVTLSPDSFLKTACEHYDPRPASVNNKSAVEFFLETYKVSGDVSHANKNCIIIAALISLNLAVTQDKHTHFFIKAVCDPRLNTRPKYVSEKEWVVLQKNLAQEYVKQEMLTWIKSQNRPLSPASSLLPTSDSSTPSERRP